MPTMNVSLTEDMLEFVERVVAEGGYASSSEVVREALRLLQHDKALEQEKIAVLRREIDLGLKAATAGHFSNKTIADIAEEVKRDHSGR